MTLLHYNETMTMTAHSSTGTAPFSTTANLTSTGTTVQKPTLASTSSGAIATFSSGAASLPEINAAIVAVAGIGAVAYGLY